MTEQRIACVTGGNKGIGRETVRRLRQEGQTVYLGARDEERGRAAAEELGTEFLRIDVTDEQSIAEAAAILERDHGRLDVLVNNAGIREPSLRLDDEGVPQPFKSAAEMTGADASEVFDTNVVGIAQPFKAAADMTGRDAQEVFDTNVFGVVRVVHAFLPLLQKSARASIINISSGMGSFAAVTDPDRGESQVSVPLYSATKASVSMLTVQYAKLLPRMRVNAVDPGLTSTDFTGNSGHTVTEATDPIVELATNGADGPTGTFIGCDGVTGW